MKGKIMRVTLKDIAAKAHVSTSLVSKVLNNREVRISDAKRQQILKIAREQGYQARQPLPATHTHKSLIGLIQPSFDFAFLTELSNVIHHHARDNGYDLVLLNSNEDIEQEHRSLDICEALQVDGILLNSCDNYANIEQIRTLIDHNIPIVFVDRYIYDLECDFVATDNYKGSYRLTKELIDKGHKDILFLFHGTAMFTTVVNERFAGYQAAMAEHGLTSIKEYVYSGRSLKYQPIYQVNKGTPSFTAIVLSTSWDFPSLLKVLDQMNYSSDAKLDIAAFDAFSVPYEMLMKGRIFERINQNLIIMQQDVKAMGELAADVVRGSIGKFVYDADGPAFLERELGWSVRVIHKLPDTTPDHVRRQHETAYQLVLKSRQFPGINIR